MLLSPKIDSVYELNSSFAYDENGIYGYHRKVNGADTVFPFKSGIYIEKLSNEGSNYSSNTIFTFVNQYKALTIDRIEVYRYDTNFLGGSELSIMDENDNNIYNKIFYGSPQAQPAVTENLSIDLTPYIEKKIKIKFSLSQYGTIVRGIRLS